MDASFVPGMVISVVSEYVPDTPVKSIVLGQNQRGIFISRPRFKDIPIPLQPDTSLTCKLITTEKILVFNSAVLEILEEGCIESVDHSLDDPHWQGMASDPVILIQFPDKVEDSDRRKSRRVAVDFPLRVDPVTGTGFFKINFDTMTIHTGNARALNISLEGILLKGTILEPGTLTQMYLYIEERWLGPVYGQVVRVEPAGVAVRFASLVEDDRETIARLL